MPPPIVFVLGLLADLLGLAPLGVTVLVLLIVHGLALRARRVLAAQGFLVVWLAFVAVAAGAALLRLGADQRADVPRCCRSAPALFQFGRDGRVLSGAGDAVHHARIAASPTRRRSRHEPVQEREQAQRRVHPPRAADRRGPARRARRARRQALSGAGRGGRPLRHAGREQPDQRAADRAAARPHPRPLRHRGRRQQAELARAADGRADRRRRRHARRVRPRGHRWPTTSGRGSSASCATGGASSR